MVYASCVQVKVCTCLKNIGKRIIVLYKRKSIMNLWTHSDWRKLRWHGKYLLIIGENRNALAIEPYINLIDSTIHTVILRLPVVSISCSHQFLSTEMAASIKKRDFLISDLIKLTVSGSARANVQKNAAILYAKAVNQRSILNQFDGITCSIVFKTAACFSVEEIELEFALFKGQPIFDSVT